jgi:hypothetical protein
MSYSRAIIRAFTAGAIAVTLSGCIIWPRQLEQYPRINGLLLANGSPLAGVTMATCTRSSPKPRFASTVTDTAGRFVLERQMGRDWVTGLIGDPLYAVCLQATQNARDLDWVKRTIGVFPDTLTLRCSIDAQSLKCTEVRALP